MKNIIVLLFILLVKPAYLFENESAKKHNVTIPSEVLQEYRTHKLKDPRSKTFTGMRANGTAIEIPLKHLLYNVDVKNSIAHIQLTQFYKNNFEFNIETEYYFSISPESAFVQLEAEINGKHIKGIIKEKQQAKEEYEQAIKEGKTAVYADIVPEVHDIMKLKLGNLLAGQSAKIIISYVEPLQVAMNKFWKLSLGNTFSDRSLPSKVVSEDLLKISNPNTVHESNKEAYDFNIEVTIHSTSIISFLKSPSHPLLITYEEDNHMATIKLDTRNQNFKPNKEFVLLYRNEDINSPQVYLEKSLIDDSYAGFITFFPDFNSDNEYKTYEKFLERFLKDQDTQDFNFYQKNIRGEFIFIVDRSGSMQGDRIQMTKKVLGELIKLLPDDSYLNIVSFGSSYISMFDQSTKLSQLDINQVINKINQFDADLGGTEILQPLQFQLENEQINGYPKNIFLITDGQVYNENEIVTLVKKHSQNSNLRVYTVGIGNGVSKNLVKEVAQEGKGKYDIITETSELNQKMSYLVKDSITPFLDNFFLEYDKNIVEMMAPNAESIKSIRKNEQFTIFVFFKNGFNSTQFRLGCRDSISGTEKNFGIEINKDMAVVGSSIHQLGIFKIMRQMLNNALYQFDALNGMSIEEKDDFYGFIKNTSIKYQVLSELTAFILIDDEKVDNNGKNINPYRVDIPVVESVDYNNMMSPTPMATGRAKRVDSYRSQQSGGILEFWKHLILIIILMLGFLYN